MSDATCTRRCTHCDRYDCGLDPCACDITPRLLGRLICAARGHGLVHIPTLHYRGHTRWCSKRKP